MDTTASEDHPLQLDMDAVRSLLTDFLRDSTSNVGFTKAVIGLSGGVDSAVAAYLAAEALGPKNVLAVKMPYATSSRASITDADAVIAALGVRSLTVEITPMVEPLFAAQSVTDPLRRGNIMARQRMIVLYDQSQKERALVIGTSNKTESLLGYGTLHGDMACALNPLGDLYKTHVWMLAETLGVPRSVITKKPSADLWEGQTDEGELGFTYRDADRLLFHMIDERRTDDELTALGFAAPFIAAVRTKVRTNQFKRRPPLIAKVSHRTVNVDFRYVRDWGV
ncbi:MAG: NAD+ synthase [Bacteroidetes bacterium]|nr:MAG: NAD+ synthase [Bacteroidota bacterium]